MLAGTIPATLHVSSLYLSAHIVRRIDSATKITQIESVVYHPSVNCVSAICGTSSTAYGFRANLWTKINSNAIANARDEDNAKGSLKSDIENLDRGTTYEIIFFVTFIISIDFFAS